MAADGYPFIDIAVLDPIRSRFAAGDALIVLNEALNTVLWANGAGAALLGHDSLQDCIGFPPALGVAALRQIRGTRGFPAISADQGLMLRVTQGLSSATLAITASGIDLPGGDRAILLASGAKDIGQADLLAGLVQGGSEAALIGKMGDVISASPGFAILGLTPETLTRLAKDVAGETGRLVKRLAPAPAGLMPVGIGRIADAPQLNLLIAVSDPSAIVAATPETPAAEPGLDQADDDAPVKPFGRRQSFDPGTPAAVDRWYFHGNDDGPGERLTRDAPPKMPAAAPLQPIEQPPAQVKKNDAGPLTVDAAASPVRFIWRTDADGRFSAISSEFAAAVGAPAANIIGRKFEEVAQVFGLDEDGEIASLLARRDTWSGRCVMWPVTGTDLKAPVDLAALPAYSRDRCFEGFKGFGVLRMGDAVRDPERIGMALASGGNRQAGTATDDAPSIDEAADMPADDPFRGEVPALAPAASPDRREADKIIRLAEHRPVAQPSAAGPLLSNTEQSAFKEIADRLAREGLARAEAASFGETQRDAGDETIEPSPAAELTEAKETKLIMPAGEAVIQAGNLTPGPDLAVLDRLPLPLLVHSGDRLHHANDEFLAVTGYGSLADLEAAGGIGALFAEDDDESESEAKAGRMLRLVTRSGAEKPVEAHLQSIPWGNSKALLLSLRPMLEKAGQPAESAPAPDIRLADANRELEQRVAELDTILDTATDGIVLIGMDGKIRSVSRAAEALFGFDSGEVAGKPFVSLFAVESQRAARDYLSGLTENGVASVLNDGREVIGREAKGRFIPLFMTIGRLPADSGFCAVLRDITQWKRAEEELGQARRLAEAASAQKTDFLARISHEIRTPLNAIIGFSELMLDEKFGPVANDRYRDYLRDINRSGSHVLDLVNDLLDISKIEAGAQDMHFEAVSLNETLSGAVSMMQPLANRERVIIRSSLASGLPEVVADLRSVKQIALNLLSNAVRFTKAGGQVIVSTSYEASGDVIMRVRDTGIGMSRPEIELALKPFRQVNTVTSGRSDGTGLGLPLTKAMVEANRAKFLIHSTPGEGTMIEISFPSTRVLAE